MGRVTRTVAELKAALDKRGIDYSKCCEKNELELLLNDVDLDQGSNVDTCNAESETHADPVSVLTVRQLKSELIARGIDTSICREKHELQKLLRQDLEREHAQKALQDTGFAVQRSSGSRCLVEIDNVARKAECMCHWEDGTSSALPWNELDPAVIDARSGLCAYEGSFENARAKAFQEQKVLVAHVLGAERSVEERFQDLVLASEEVSSLVSGNAIFWKGYWSTLKPTHAQMIAPNGMSSIAMALPLAIDAMRVLSVLPMPNKDLVVNSFVGALEIHEEHRTSAEAREFSEDALLRKEQDDEFAAALAKDQEKAEVDNSIDKGSEAVVSDDSEKMESISPAIEELEEMRRHLAKDFLDEAPPAGSTTRLMMRFPSGERVQRIFSIDTRFSRVYDWAQCCPFLPEGAGKQIIIPSCFDFNTSYPPQKLGPDMNDKTLFELGLVPSAALLVIEKDE